MGIKISVCLINIYTDVNGRYDKNKRATDKFYTHTYVLIFKKLRLILTQSGIEPNYVDELS